MQIYQVFTGRLESANVYDDTKKVFRKMERFDWSKVVSLGFTHIYLLGIFDSRGPIVVSTENGADISNHKNRIPSVFAINDHSKPHPLLGSKQDFVHLVDVLHDFSLKVIVDFVPNQTNLVHKWVSANPDYYKKVEKNFETGFSGDVAMLDLSNSNLRQELFDVLQTILSLRVDAVRCDMAHLAPIDFWEEMIGRIKEQSSQFQFIAEAYSQDVFNWKPINDLFQAGFDQIYHEFLYRKIKQAVLNSDIWSDLAAHVNYVLSDYKYASNLIHYLNNHDDPLTISKEFIPGWWMLLSMLKGGLLAFNGLFNGKLSRLAHHHVDLLSEDVLELSSLSDNWFRQVEFTKRYRPRIKKVDYKSGILHADLESNKGMMAYQMKMTDNVQSADQNVLKCLIGDENLSKPGCWAIYKKKA